VPAPVAPALHKPLLVRKVAYWITAGVFAALVASKFNPDTGFSSLIRFGADWDETRLAAIARTNVPVAKGAGYDGQFYAQVAVDPMLRDAGLAAALDAPAYRARRILVPAIAHAIAWGHPALIVQVFALLNVVCWCVFAFLLRREIGAGTPEDFARWFACVFSLGVLDSVRQSLVDLPALALVLIAVRATRAGAPRTAAAWSGLATLAKETSALATLALLVTPTRRPSGWMLFALSLVPFLAWLAYVAWRLPGGGSGLGNFTWPFWGLAAQAVTSGRELAAGNLDSRHTFALLGIVGLLLQAGVVVRIGRSEDPWWRIGVAHAALLVVLGPWVWNGYWAACRALLPLSLAFNLLLPAGKRFWPLWIVGNLTLLHGVWRFL
jgi:hypothetical protein